jgi:transposase
MTEHSKITVEVIRAAMALAQRDVDLGLITVEQIEAIPRTRFAPVERKKIAEALSTQGMSNRQIAKVVGASEGTIRNDLSNGAQDCADTAQNYASHEGNGANPEAAAEARKAEYAALDGDDNAEAKPFVDIPDDREMKKRRAQFLKAAGAALGYAQAYDGPIDAHVIKVASAVAAQWRQFVRQLREQRHHGKAQI